MNFRFFIFLFFFVPHTLLSNSKITGVVKSSPNKKISILKIDEYIGNNKLSIGKTITDDFGNFSFNLENNETNYYEIVVDSKITGLYISTNTDYEIEIIPEKNTNKAAVIFYNLPADDLNNLINNCKNKTADFLNENIRNQGTGKFKLSTKLFADSLVESAKKYNNNFYSKFAMYHAGTLEILAQTNNKYIFDKYIDTIKIDYNHPEFYNFLSTFYGNYFDTWSAKFDEQLLNKILSENHLYAPLDSLLKKDIFLKNEEIRELVAIVSMHENYFNKDYNQKVIQEILSDLAKTTMHEQIKKIALAVIQSLPKNNVGEIVEDFCLPNLKEEKICLSDFKNEKITLVEFTSGNNIICQKEMSLVGNLRAKYKDDINFISIFLNSETKNASLNFLNENKELNWTILFSDDNNELEIKYNLTTFPCYLILNSEKKIIVANAPNPSENLETILFKLIGKGQENTPAIGEKN